MDCRQRALVAKAAELLEVVRLRSLLASGELVLDLEPAEITAIFSASEALVSEDNKQTVLNGFLFGQGVIEDVPCMQS